MNTEEVRHVKRVMTLSIWQEALSIKRGDEVAEDQARDMRERCSVTLVRAAMAKPAVTP